MSKTYLAIPEIDVSRLGPILSRAEQLGYAEIKIGDRHISVAKAQTVRNEYEKHVLEVHRYRSECDALTRAGKSVVDTELAMQKSMRRAGIDFCLYLFELGLLRSLPTHCPDLPSSLGEDALLKKYWDIGFSYMRQQFYSE